MLLQIREMRTCEQISAVVYAYSCACAVKKHYVFTC